MKRGPSQRDRVLARLRSGPTCGTELLAMHIPRYSARIYELRQQGYVVSERPCRFSHHDHESRQLIYELETIDQMRLPV